MGGGVAQGRGAVGRVDGASGAIPRTASATAAKRSSCSPMKSSPGSSAVAKWVQTPASSSRSSPATGAGELDHRVRVALAEPPHPAVVLDVDPGHPPSSAAARRAELPEALAPHRESARASSATSSSSPVSAPMARIGVSGKCAGAPRPRRRPQPRAGWPRRAAPRRRTRRPVAVAVGLDHRAELGAAPDPVLSARQFRSTAPTSIVASARPVALGRLRAPAPRGAPR